MRIRRLAAMVLLEIAIGAIFLFTYYTHSAVTAEQEHVQFFLSPPLIPVGGCVTVGWHADVTKNPAVTLSLQDKQVALDDQTRLCNYTVSGYYSIALVARMPGSEPVQITHTIGVYPTDMRLWLLVLVEVGFIITALYLLEFKVIKNVLSLFRDRIAVPWANFAGQASFRKTIHHFLPLLCTTLIIVYCVAMHWDFAEVTRLVLGLIGLWGGPALLIYGFLQVKPGVIRITLSLLGAYALTTPTYFFLSVLQLGIVFYALEVVIWIYLLYRASQLVIKVRRHRNSRIVLKPDWTLILLICLSCIVTIPQKTVYRFDPETGSVTYQLWVEQMNNVEVSYELARHVPILQAATHAGLPERAYHLFPHLTTTLIAAFTGQSDMMRVHVPYHYTVIEVLICLALFSLVRFLTESRWAGYLAVLLMYILAIWWPPFYPTSQLHQYFTLFPHGISGLELVALTTAQMYSGLVVFYGALLGMLLVYKRDNLQLLVLTSLFVGALLRFRLHFWITLFPAFVLLVLILAFRRRKAIYLVPLVLSLVISGVSYLEMRSPIYLPGTAGVTVGYNALATTGLASEAIHSFPFAFNLQALIEHSIANPELAKWLWQYAGITGFVLLNIVGLPLLGATLYVVFSKHPSRTFGALLALCVVLTIVEAGILGSEYGADALSGQQLFHTRWYVFPLMPAAIWILFQIVRRELAWPRETWITISVLGVIFFLLGRSGMGPSPLELSIHVGWRMEAHEWEALHYIHDFAPQDAVLITDRYLDDYTFIVGGITGRRTYYEKFEYTADQWRHVDPDYHRPEDIHAIWTAASEDEFCQRLAKIPRAMLIEYADSQLHAHPKSCLSLFWHNDKITIWMTP